jgi:hypothetical protein
LGVTRNKRALWVFVNCLIVVVIAQALVFGVSNRLNGHVIQLAFQAAQQERDLHDKFFSDQSADDTFGVTIQSYEHLANPTAIIVFMLIQTAALLATAAVFAVRISHVNHMHKKE